MITVISKVEIMDKRGDILPGDKGGAVPNLTVDNKMQVFWDRHRNKLICDDRGAWWVPILMNSEEIEFDKSDVFILEK